MGNIFKPGIVLKIVWFKDAHWIISDEMGLKKCYNCTLFYKTLD